jgi:TolB-like protein
MEEPAPLAALSGTLGLDVIAIRLAGGELGAVAGDDSVRRRKLFLSYAREDQARIVALAGALEAAGFEVWSDLALRPGRQFSAEIARELDSADVVVVAWSAASINSDWVRDEAGVGLDRGCLAPVLIDAVKPPLGFRQLHAFDLRAWQGDEDDPRIHAFVTALGRLADKTAPPWPSAQGVPAPRRRSPWAWAAGILAATACLGLLWLFWPHGPAGKPVIAVLPFTNMLAPAKEAYFAEGLGEEILDALAQDPRLSVLGGATARAIRDRADDPNYARRTLGVTRLLEGSVRGGLESGDAHVKVSVRLIDTGSGVQLWSQSYDRAGNDILSIEEDIARAVAAETIGSVVGAPDRPAARRNTPAEAYEKVIVAQQMIRTRQPDALRRAQALAGDAIAMAPDYAPAYAARAAAANLLATYGEPQKPGSLRDAQTDAETAVRLDPTLSDGFAVLSLILWSNADQTGAIRTAREAIARSPNNAEAHLHLAYFLGNQNELEESMNEFAEAAKLDPLWYLPVISQILDCAEANQPARARLIADHFRALSVDLSDTDLADGLAARAAGDYAGALKRVGAAAARSAKVTMAALSRDDLLRTLFSVTGVATPTDLAGAAGRLMASRDLAAAAAIAARMGVSIWDDSETSANLAHALVAGGRSKELLQSFDSRFNTVQAYAASTPRSDMSGVAVALAFDRAGRPADARAMRDTMKTRLLASEAGGLAPTYDAVEWAAMLVADGNDAEAIHRLEVGSAAQWWAVCGGPFWLGDLPELATLRGNPRFAAVLDGCRSRINSERAKAGLGAVSLR